MKILIIEPCSKGHRAVYATRLVRGAVERGHEVVFTTLEGSLSHDEYTELAEEKLEGLSILGSKLRLASFAGKNSILSELAHWILLRKLFRESQKVQTFDVVLVCYLDSALHMITLMGSPFGNTPFAGIVMKVKFHHPRAGINTPVFKLNPVKEWMFYRLLGRSTLRAIFTIDETLPESVTGEQTRNFSKIVLICDPAKVSSDAKVAAGTGCREYLESSAIGLTILVYGWLTRRKGVTYLLDALQDLLTRGLVANVLLVGEQDDSIRESLSQVDKKALRASGHIRVIDRFISSAEENEVFKHADIVWLAYEDFYVMSGVMVQAGMMGLPVVVADQGLVSYMTHKYNCGMVIRLDNGADVRDALQTLIENGDLRSAMGKRAIAKYTGYSVEKFNEVIFNRLESQ